MILPVPLTRGKITFLVPLEMATPQQKAFRVLEFAKTRATVAVLCALRTELGIDPPYRKSI